MNGVKVVRPGLLTTVQDNGRYAYQRFGVSITGVMDRYASAIANFLVGNDAGEAVLETTLLGPALEFQQDCAVAVAGADMSPTLDGVPVPMWQCIQVKAGSTLAFGALKSGARSYIAFSGGIDVPEVMGSRSTYAKAKVGGFEGRPLKAGDILPVNRMKVNPAAAPVLAVPEGQRPSYGGQSVLRVVLGPQDDYFDQQEIDAFFRSTYTVGKECDRMGYRLDGPPIKHKTGADIISDGIMMGSIQVPGNGLPIILMADRQTTGGYTKIGTVISTDLPLVAQAKAGDTFTFQLVSVEESHQILLQAAEAVKQLQAACTAPVPPQANPLEAVAAVAPGMVKTLPVYGNPQSFDITVDGVSYAVTVEEKPI